MSLAPVRDLMRAKAGQPIIMITVGLTERRSTHGVEQHKARQASGTPPPIWRRIFHIAAGSSIPVAGIFFVPGAMVVALAVLSAGALGLDLVRFRVGWLNRQFLRWLAPLLKEGEGHRITGATYMVVASLTVFLLFDAPMAVASLLFLSLGDPAAALVGLITPGPRVSGKSPGGTVAFLVVSLAVVGLLTASGAVDYHWGLLAGAAVAALVELAPLPVDDNFTIPVVSGAAMHFLVA